MHSNWPVLAKLFFSFVHLANEINESFPWLWHSLLRPIGELELTNCPRLAILEENNVLFCLNLIFNYSKNVITIQMPHKLSDSPWHLWLWTLGGCTGACCTRPWDPPQSTGTWLSALQASTGDTSPAGGEHRGFSLELFFFFFFFQRLSVEWEQFLATLSWKYLPDFWKFIIHLEIVLCQMRYDAHGI